MLKNIYWLFTLSTLLLSVIGIQAFAQTSNTTVSIRVNPGWNLLSLPVRVPNNTTDLLFPSAKSKAFNYQSSYLSVDTINNGTGFWLKFDSTETISITGKSIYTDTIVVHVGWNMIGALSSPLAIDSIKMDPPGIVISSYYSYSSGYVSADTLQTGYGYWVKVNENGLLILASQTPCPGTPTIDYGGKTYNTVQIGDQCWLRENLDVGTMINGVANQTDNDTLEKYCFDNNPAKCDTFGGLYQWSEAMRYFSTEGSQGICPDGWHIPTIAEFETLRTAVNGDGNALKAIGQGAGTGAGTNLTGFSALLGGHRNYLGSFYYPGTFTHIWSSTEYDPTFASYMILEAYNNNITLDSYYKTSGLSVRCVKGEGANHPPSQPTIIYPHDNSTGLQLSPPLFWSCTDPEADPIIYTIYLGTTNPPTTVVSSNQADAFFQLYGLSGGTQYFWKIVAKDFHGDSTTGPIWNFTTNYPPSIPANPNPADSAVKQPLDVTLTWAACNDPDADPIKYDVYFGRDNPPTIVYSHWADTSFLFFGMTSGTPYYWKIVAWDNYGNSTSGPVWYFTTRAIPSVPTLSSPLNGAINQDTLLTFRWRISNGATSYTLQVSTDSLFSSYFYNQSGLSDTSHQIDSLNRFTIYYWRVSATNSDGTSGWSSVRKFKTAAIMNITCPGIPTVDYAGKTYNTVQIGSQCWLRENLDVGIMIIPSGCEYQDNDETIEKYCYNDNPAMCDTFGGLYRWREAMKYATEAGSQGICPTGWHIPTRAEFDTLITTVGGDGNALKAIGQGISAGAGTNTSGFSALLAGFKYSYGFDGLKGYTLFWSSTQHDIDSTYIIQLRNSNSIIYARNQYRGDFYSVRCIQDSVEPNLRPAYPSNLNPTSGSVDVDTTITLSWTCTDPDNDPLTYDVYLGRENPPTTMVSSNQIGTSIERIGLAKGTTYYWQITAKDDHNHRTSGSVQSFTTSSYGGTSCPETPIVNLAGKIYNTVKIGNQCWLKENLDVGAMINIDYLDQSNNGIIEKFCYNNDPAKCDSFGGLYQWNEAMQYVTTEGAKGICPSGWHIPTRAEFETLKVALRSNGNSLKAVGWGCVNGKGTDSSGFSALLSGMSDNGDFWDLDYISSAIWSSKKYSDLPSVYFLDYYTNNFYFDESSVLAGLSVRCIMDSGWSNNSPDFPSNPNPSNGMLDVDTTITLSWTCTDPENDPLIYDLYFGTDNPPETIISSDHGVSSIEMSGLVDSTEYFWKIVAKDDHGNSTTGPVWKFTTLLHPCSGETTVVYHGKTYHTVQIVSQCWLKENLDVGIMILGGDTAKNNGIIEKFCYNNDTNNCNIYGGLYQWDEAMQYDTARGAQGICPIGWHIPTIAEYQTLRATVGGDGNALKEIGQGTGAGAGTNTSGFSTLLSGSYNPWNVEFRSLGLIAIFWTSTVKYSVTSMIMYLIDTNNFIYTSSYTPKDDGESVRCVKD